MLFPCSHSDKFHTLERDRSLDDGRQETDEAVGDRVGDETRAVKRARVPPVLHGKHVKFCTLLAGAENSRGSQYGRPGGLLRGR